MAQETKMPVSPGNRKQREEWLEVRFQEERAEGTGCSDVLFEVYPKWRKKILEGFKEGE